MLGPIPERRWGGRWQAARPLSEQRSARQGHGKQNYGVGGQHPRQRGRVQGSGLLTSSQAKHDRRLGADGSAPHEPRKAQVLKMLDSRESAESTFSRQEREDGRDLSAELQRLIWKYVDHRKVRGGGSVLFRQMARCCSVDVAHGRSTTTVGQVMGARRGRAPRSRCSRAKSAASPSCT